MFVIFCLSTLSLPDSPDLPSKRCPAGRRRDSSRDDALRQAALDLVAEVGYQQLTIEAVAARAGAGKATVYRRWSGKAALVADALAHAHAGLEVPDTGSVRGDLVVFAGRLFCGVSADAVYRIRLVTGMISGMLADPELRQASRQIVLSPASAIREIIERAVERGEIEEPRDPNMIVAVLPALAFHRLIFTGEGPDPAFAQAVIDNILLPALLAGPAPASTEAD